MYKQALTQTRAIVSNRTTHTLVSFGVREQKGCIYQNSVPRSQQLVAQFSACCNNECSKLPSFSPNCVHVKAIRLGL